MNSSSSPARALSVALCLLAAGFLHAPPVHAATYSGGSGTELAPYLISTPQDLQDLSNPANSADWDKHFLMTQDVDMVGVTGFMPIGNSTTKFAGVFDGDGYVVLNLSIDRPSENYIGLFGLLDGSGGVGTGEIKGLGIDGESFSGAEYVGGIIGSNINGTVTNCYTSGTVLGTGRIGGLVGQNYGTLTGCYTMDAVTGTSGSVGGLVGENELYSKVTACYATGDVFSGGSKVGGLVGTNSGTVTGCYATGTVSGTDGVGGLVGPTGNHNPGTAVASFWDTETSGQPGGYGGKGLTSTQMNTVRIFQNAGWATYGWVMTAGQYPQLAWENTGDPAIPSREAVVLSGSGTDIDPYLVATPTEFASLSWHIDVLDAHLSLTGDLDLLGIALCPIGDLGPFTGFFAGGGHSLINVAIERPNSGNVGVFSWLDADGEIRNITLQSGSVVGKEMVGGLVGMVTGGAISLCRTSLSVSGELKVGGLVGDSRGQITSCNVSGEVSGVEYVGGLVGNNEGPILQCYTEGPVTGIPHGHGGPAMYTGGLVGWNFDAVARCYTTGDVSGGTSLGGLIGTCWSSSSIQWCSASGAVSGVAVVGGLVGGHHGSSTCNYATGTVTSTTNRTGGFLGTMEGSVSQCYATGDVSCDGDRVGGFAGYLEQGTMTECYASGAVSGISNLGGLVGTSGGTVVASFWDTETGGPDNGIGTGLPTDQMMQRTSFDPPWDFSSDDGDDPDWLIYEDASYPKLYAMPIPINSVSALQLLNIVSGGEFFLTADIDASDTAGWAVKSAQPGFLPIGSEASPFEGILHGYGHRIHKLLIYRPDTDDVGLFGYIGATGVVDDLGLEQVNITGRDQVGGLAGVNEGSVERCYVRGEVTGVNAVGGLIGDNQGAVSNSYAAAALSGNTVGGLIGTDRSKNDSGPSISMVLGLSIDSQTKKNVAKR